VCVFAIFCFRWCVSYFCVKENKNRYSEHEKDVILFFIDFEKKYGTNNGGWGMGCIKMTASARATSEENHCFLCWML
jgi:hypothetical protein